MRRALSPNGKATDWIEKRRLDYEIKSLVRKKAHLRRHITVENLRKNASSLSFADFAARIKKVQDATDHARRLDDELKPRNFFGDKPPTENIVALRKYTLPREMEYIYRQAIIRAKKGKAAGPDGVPIETLLEVPILSSRTLA